MSKYNLVDILNEYIGGGRIGTLRISYKDLVDKMDELEKSGKVIVREKGSSADGKVNREFEVVDRNSPNLGTNKQERGFTVYDYKFGFDPGDQDNFTEEYDFSVGGNDLQLAMDLIDGVKAFGIGDFPNLKEDEFDEARQAAIESSQRAAGIKENIPPSRDDKIMKDLAKADEVIKMIKMMNPDVREDLLIRIARMGQKLNEGDLFSSEFDRGELKAIINDLNKGLILDMPTRRAYKFLVSLLDKQDKEEMGLNEEDKEPRDGVKSAAAKLGIKPSHVKQEQMYIDDEEFEMEMGRSKKDSLKKEMMIHIDQLIDGNIDMNDFMNVVEDIMAEVKSMKEVMGIDRKGRKKPESKSNMTKVNEESSKKVKIRAYLKDYYTNPKDPKDVRIDDKLIDEFFEFSDDNSINIESMDMDDIVGEYDEFIFLNKDVMEDVRKQFKRFL